jgi:hypothetical protein
MAIVDVYFNLQVTSKKSPSSENTKDNIVKIIPPGIDDYCLASRDSISVDPSVCLVSNPLAFQNEFIEGINPVFEKNKGVITPVKTTILKDSRYYNSSGFVTLPPFYDENLKVGLIGEIYVNISLLLNEYKNIKNASNDEGVNLTVYFKNVLNKISNALGGLNNFSLSTAGRDQNTLRIIDLYYLEQDSSNSKYIFDLMGLNTIVRDANVESQIFENQSTIVAIAAQSRANLGDVYNSTQVYLNAGIEDRVALSKFQPEELNNFENKGNKDNTFYAKLFNFLLYVRDNVVGASADDNYAISTSNSGTVPYSFLKQFMLKYNGELNFKALLPFKLNIKLDGIGGIVVGEIFKVKKDILPKNYADKNLGFVITKISHDLTNNDWETTLETQICLLDNISLGKNFITTTRQGFGEYVSELKLYGLIYVIAHQFVRYQAYRSMIGFLWLSQNPEPQRNIEDGFDYLGFDYTKIFTNSPFIQPLDDKDIIDELWAPNTKYMLLGQQQNGLDPVQIRNDISWFSIYQFREYITYWIIAYKNKYRDQLSTTSINNITLLDSFNKLEKELSNEQSSFTSLVDTISGFLVTDYEKVYTPDNSNNNSLTLLPYNDNYPLIINQSSTNFSTTGVTDIYKSTLGIDQSKLDNNIQNYFNNNSDLQTLKNQYNDLLSKIPLAEGTAINDDPLLYTIPPLMDADVSIGIRPTSVRDIRNITVNKNYI